MAWMKIETSVARHRKFINAGPGPSWLWICGMAYSKEGLTDGFIPDEAIGYLGLKEHIARRMAVRLEGAGLWHRVENGWQINDFLDLNKSAEEVLAIKTQRKLAGKSGGLRSGEERRTRSEPVIVDHRVGEESATAQITEQNDESAKQVASTIPEASVEPRVERESRKKEREAFASQPLSHTPTRQHATLIPKRRLDAAWEGPKGLYVPQKLHQQFVALRGGDERSVDAFYGDVGEEWGYGARKGDEPGADMFRFWNARYEERWPPTPQKSPAKDVGPAYRKVVVPDRRPA